MTSSYKILRVAGIHYRSVMRLFGASFGQLSYRDQQTVLFQNGYVYSNSFSKGMGQLGHDAHEVVYDLEEMQKKWAEEHTLSYRTDRWQIDILLAQIEKMRPDLLIFQDIYSLPYEIRKSLKARFPFLKLVIIFRGFPGDSPVLYKDLSTADVLLLGSPRLIEKCRRAGLHPHHVYHYFDESVLRRVEQEPSTQNIEKCDFSYIGTSGFGYGIEYLERYAHLKRLLEKTPLNAWIDEPRNGKSSRGVKALIRKLTKAFFILFPRKILFAMQEKNSWPKFRGVFEEVIQRQSIPQRPLTELFPNACHTSLFGVGMYQRLYRSRITFNKHAGAARGTVDNIRLFQATGMGTCLLTDRGSNLSDLFEEDREIVAYSSLDECIEKAMFLLKNEAFSKEIGMKGQKRTLKDHTALKRCQQMDEIFQGYLRKK